MADPREFWQDHLRPASRRAGFWHHRKFKRKNRSLRRRLTVIFAFVALAAVFMTTWFTLGAVYDALFPHDQGGQLWKQHPSSDPEIQQARALFKNITRKAFLAGLLSFVLASVVAAIVTRFYTLPLAILTEGARRLEQGERHIRLRLPHNETELRSLTEAFNNLVSGLERQEAWRRNLVADIAHDLRTPLAVLRSEIEAMQDGVTPTDEAGLDRLHHQVMLLSRLVSDLRTLSLAEGGGLQLRMETTGLQAFLDGVVQGFSPRAASRGFQIVTRTVPPNLTAVFDSNQITRVLNNLLENAVLYGQGPIEITAKRLEGQVTLQVRDHGPGIPSTALERVFERFYKGDFSRTRQSAEDVSSGLGLPIARAIMEAHKGKLEASNHPDGGALFVLSFPDGHT